MNQKFGIERVSRRPLWHCGSRVAEIFLKTLLLSLKEEVYAYMLMMIMLQ